MGQSLQNLDGMIRAPYGCGEQNMISLVPNIYALSYMKAAGIAKPEIETKAKKNMKQGMSLTSIFYIKCICLAQRFLPVKL